MTQLARPLAALLLFSSAGLGYRNAAAQVRLDQDATLAGIRSLGLVVIIQGNTSLLNELDTASLRRGLAVSIELEIRRIGIRVLEPPFCSSGKCPDDFTLLYASLLLVPSSGGNVIVAHDLEAKQVGALFRGYVGFLTSWSNGGVLEAHRAALASETATAVKSNLELFLNAFLKANPP